MNIKQKILLIATVFFPLISISGGTITVDVKKIQKKDAKLVTNTHKKNYRKNHTIQDSEYGTMNGYIDYINEEKLKGGEIQHKYDGTTIQTVNVRNYLNTKPTQDEIIKILIDRISTNRVKSNFANKNLDSLRVKYANLKKTDVMKFFSSDGEGIKMLQELDKQRNELDKYMRDMNELKNIYSDFGQTFKNNNNNIARLNAYRKEYIESVAEFQQKLVKDYLKTNAKKDKTVQELYKDKKYNQLNFRELSLLTFDEILKKQQNSPTLSENYYHLYELMIQNVNLLSYTSNLLNTMSRNVSFAQIELGRKRQSQINAITIERGKVSSTFSRTSNDFDAYTTSDFKDYAPLEKKRVMAMYDGNRVDILNKYFGKKTEKE